MVAFAVVFLLAFTTFALDTTKAACELHSG